MARRLTRKQHTVLDVLGKYPMPQRPWLSTNEVAACIGGASVREAQLVLRQLEARGIVHGRKINPFKNRKEWTLTETGEAIFQDRTSPVMAH
jgi:hypothetical protein